MLAILPYESLLEIMKYLKSSEIIALCKLLEDLFKDLFEEMIKHTNLTINFTEVLSDKQIKWFESKNIKVKLLEEYKIDTDGKQYLFENGILQCDENDSPAVIYSNFIKYGIKTVSVLTRKQFASSNSVK
jgi:hypothetical protein